MKKRDKMCRCHKKQNGGAFLSPAQVKKLMGPVRRFSTMPVRKPKQYGMGHCSLEKPFSKHQHGSGFFGDLGNALTGAFHDPLRGLAAGLTLGASEVVAVPADLFKRRTGVKASTVLDKGSKILTGINPELGMGAKGTSFGLKQIGLGKKKRRGRPKKRVPAKKRKGKKR
jgi:hypothetical protein